ncbi:T9SS type A sorting domain-containing protein [Aureivirga sp. CE67]|uniref:T9SS type A sorting domain-containing protein n=1 Tax=Aureivirga sp. CE67 TaxID=1788983 RepID=UPI0018C978C8|nr:T9SS type A sorting domain-containing protein [Aureivirga sp. CE67]
MKYHSPLTLFLLLFLTLYSNAQELTATLIEINKGAGLYPLHITKCNNGFYFSGYHGPYPSGHTSNSRELWFSDGTVEGTRLVKDIIPDSDGSKPNNLTMLDNTLFFVGRNENLDYCLYKSDGTSEGTEIVTDVDDNIFLGQHQDLIAFNNRIIFSQEDGTWATNGISEVTYKITDQQSYNKFIFNGELYFFTGLLDGIGYSLWKTDGTELGTAAVYSWANSESYEYQYMNVIKGEDYFYFVGKNETSKREIWKSDGTTAGTTLVKDFDGNIQYTPSILNGTLLNEDLIFLQARNNEIQLWKISENGEESQNIYTFENDEVGTLTYDSLEVEMTEFNNQVFFYMDDGEHGKEIWKTNGTESGTQLVKDINPEEGKGIYIDRFHVDELNNKLFFFSKNSPESNVAKTLWTTDGTTTGTYEFASHLKAVTGTKFFTFEGKTLFNAYTYESGIEIWETDGTIFGTKLSIETSVAAGSDPEFLISTDDKIYFEGYHYGHLLQDIFSCGETETSLEEASIFIEKNSVKLNDEYFFVKNHEDYGKEVWKTNLSTNTSEILKDIHPENGSSMIIEEDQEQFTYWNNALYFTATDGENGKQLWKTDGTEQGTYAVSTIDISENTNPFDITVFEDQIYFLSKYGGLNSLWKSDGTTAGTVELSNDVNNKNLRALDDKLLLFQNEVGSSFLGHIYSWENEAKHLIHTFDTGFSGIKQSLISSDNKLHFSIIDYSNDIIQLYETNGTEEGTHLNFEIIDSELEKITSIIECGESIFFTIGPNEDHTKEIWKVDDEGVELLDIVENEANDIKSILCLEDYLVYINENYPDKVWFYNSEEDFLDGRTPIVTNNEYTNNSIKIEDLGKTKYNLYIAASTIENGTELYITKPEFLPLNVEEPIKHEHIEELVKIFPNPTKNFIQIKANNSLANFEFYDLKGKLIHTKTIEQPISETTYDVRSFDSGIYLLKVNLSNGKSIHSKIIIH